MSRALQRILCAMKVYEGMMDKQGGALQFAPGEGNRRPRNRQIWGSKGGEVSSGECLHPFALFKHKLTVMLTMTNCASTNAMKRCSGVGELGEATACAAGCMH